MKKRAFVTGGTGFIGQRMVRRLLEGGWEVVVLARTKDKTRVFNRLKLKVVLGDIRDRGWFKQVLGCDLFVHLSGVHGSVPISLSERVKIEMLGTKNALLSAKRARVQHFIHISSAYLGLPTVYGKTKALIEEVVTKQIKKGLPITIVRPVVVYGEGDLVNLLRLFKSINQGKFFGVGSGKTEVCLIYADDLIDGLEKVINNPQKSLGQIVILGRDRVSWQEFVNKVADILKVRRPSLFLPSIPMMILGKVFFQFAQRGFKVPFTSDSVITFIKDSKIDLATSQKMLNFSPKTSLGQGLTKTLSWYKKQGLL